jgi:hypothetical protein
MTSLVVVLAFLTAQSTAQLVPRVVLKLVVDHPVLAPYLHPEASGRVPLAVSDHMLASGVTPSKFGRPIQIVPDRETGTRPHLRFIDYKENGSRATATIEYKVEGIQVTFTLETTSPGWWTVVDTRLVQNK